MASKKALIGMSVALLPLFVMDCAQPPRHHQPKFEANIVAEFTLLGKPGRTKRFHVISIEAFKGFLGNPDLAYDGSEQGYDLFTVWNEEREQLRIPVAYAVPQGFCAIAASRSKAEEFAEHGAEYRPIVWDDSNCLVE